MLTVTLFYPSTAFSSINRIFCRTKDKGILFCVGCGKILVISVISCLILTTYALCLGQILPKVIRGDGAERPP